MTISLCMIVKDEAKTLPRCLERAVPWVDEMILVDTGSTDATVEVARGFGAQVYAFAWNDDFSAARNVSLSYATGDWILVLDADEILEPETGKQLRALDQRPALDETSEELPLAATLLRWEEGAQQAPYTLVTRFFRNREDIRFNRPYHETVDESLEVIRQTNPGMQILMLPGIGLRHSGYQAKVINAREKFKRAYTIMAAYLEANPYDAYTLNKLGALYGEQKDWAQSLAMLRSGLMVASPDDSLTRYELHYHMGLARRGLKQLDKAVDCYRQALEQPVPNVVKLSSLMNLGSLLKLLGQLEAAAKQFEQAIEVDPTFAMAYFNLGVVRRSQGRLDEAVSAYRQAIRYDPVYPQAYQNLGVTLHQQGQFMDCVDAFSRAVQLYQQINDAQAAERLRQGIQGLGLPSELLAAAHLQ